MTSLIAGHTIRPKPTATERLRAFESHHRIEIDRSRDPYIDRCDTDGIRVYQVLTRRWQHDMNEVEKLRQEARREDLDRGIVTFPSPDEIERAGQIAREAAATFAAIEAENDYFRAHEDDGPDEACVEDGHAPSCTCGLGSDPLLVVGSFGGFPVEAEWS